MLRPELRLRGELFLAFYESDVGESEEDDDRGRPWNLERKRRSSGLVGRWRSGPAAAHEAQQHREAKQGGDSSGEEGEKGTWWCWWVASGSWGWVRCVASFFFGVCVASWLVYIKFWRVCQCPPKQVLATQTELFIFFLKQS